MGLMVMAVTMTVIIMMTMMSVRPMGPALTKEGHEHEAP